MLTFRDPSKPTPEAFRAFLTELDRQLSTDGHVVTIEVQPYLGARITIDDRSAGDLYGTMRGDTLAYVIGPHNRRYKHVKSMARAILQNHTARIATAARRQREAAFTATHITPAETQLQAEAEKLKKFNVTVEGYVAYPDSDSAMRASWTLKVTCYNDSTLTPEKIAHVIAALTEIEGAP